MTIGSKSRVVLGATLLAAAGVRLWGVRFGLPAVQARPDEIATVGVAMGFLEHQWWPALFDYPRLLMYVYALLFAAYGWVATFAGTFATYSEFVRTWKANWPTLFLIGRWVSIISGTATVWVIYRIGRRRFGEAAALLGAAFLAFAFLHVRDSHYATTDVPMTLLAWISIALLVSAYDTGSRARLRTAALVAALATATKYSSAMLSLPVALVAVLWFLEGRASRYQAIRELGLLALIMIGTFLALSPYVIFDYERFDRAMAILGQSYNYGMKTAEPLGRGWWYHVRVSLWHGVGLPLLIAGLVGQMVMARRWPRWTLLIASFPVAYYLTAGGARLVFVRYVIPIVPFLCLAAGVLVDRLAARLTSVSARTAAAAAVCGLLLVPSVRSVWTFDRLLAHTDTRAEAADWFSANAPGAASIAQSGSEYGRVQFWWGHPYRLWFMEARTGHFIEGRFTPVDGLPDYIVVQESALPYSYVLPQMQALLRDRYTLVQTFFGSDPNQAGNTYDLQDAFFLPYAGFRRVDRPGPNLYIWRLRR